MESAFLHMLFGTGRRAPNVPDGEPGARQWRVTDLERYAAPEEAGRGGKRWRSEAAGAGLVRGVRSTAFRLRREAAPHAATGVIAAAGFATNTAVEAGATTAGAAAVVSCGVCAAAALYATARTRRRHRKWARRVALGGAAATVWLTAAPFVLEPWTLATLLTAEWGLAARWWQAIRLGYPTPDRGGEDDEDPAEPEIPPAAQTCADWETYVGDTGGPAPGSRLTAPRTTDVGDEFVLDLARGRHTPETILAALPKIATGLDIPLPNLVVDRHPLFPDQPSRLRFQVVRRSPISGEVLFDGPRRRLGLLEVGPYADGRGEAPWRLYGGGGMWGGLIIGGSGLGKSRVIENLAVSAMSGGDTIVWFIDPQGGASSPALAEHADWYVGLDGAADVLAAAAAIGKARAAENAAEGWQGFVPSPQRPGIKVVIDECHRVFADRQAATGWGYVARELRKVGVAIVAASQYAGQETFGGNETLRASIMGGNTLCMRVESRYNGQSLTGLSVDPLTLPAIPGYAYTNGGEARTAPCRNRLIRDAAAWMARQPRADLDALSATATLMASTAYRDRRVRKEVDQSKARELVAMLRVGHVPAAEATASPSPQVPTGQLEGMGAVVIPIRPLTAADLRASAPRLDPEQLDGSLRRCFEAIAAGVKRPADLEKRLDLSKRQVQNLLKDLVDGGLVDQPGHGQYRLARLVRVS